MSIFSWSGRQVERREQARQAVEIARTCQAEVFGLVRLRLAEMVLAEARGYIRARAGRRVLAEVQWRLARRQLAEASTGVVQELAIRTLIESVLAEHVRDLRRVQTRRAA